MPVCIKIHENEAIRVMTQSNWYVIQTRSGEETDVRNHLEVCPEHECISRYFIPLYEEVRRKGGTNRILFRRLFPGYLFIETSDPDRVFGMLKGVPGFTRILGGWKDEDDRMFIPLTKDDIDFLDSILDDGVMHVSHVVTPRGSREIKRITGPLARYRNHITLLDKRHREAIVDTHMFGKKRRIRFGLWLDGDPKLAWLEEKESHEQDEALDDPRDIDIGIYPGDRVVDMTGIFGDVVFTVERVNPRKRLLDTRLEAMGTSCRTRLFVDQIRKI